MQTLKGKWLALSLLSGCAASLAGPAYTIGGSGAANPAAAPAFQDWIAVDSAVLERMRGGFDIAPGLKVSFGIERLVNLNGVLQTATRIEVPVAGSPANLPGGTAGLVQNGLGNTFAPAALSQGAVGTFIQNSISNQTIQSLTIINATTNSLEMLKGANLQSTLFDALTQSTGTR
ncbi:hypothetical protein [Janthinobacterium sp. 17J80-10]|uniref:hypothetical protein n=1 Tax=Janthinobacterium sp. 17J80-10 TaxID=2497863 RepID=UPI00100548A2|nr:hypothetical protein [Janthinobacterium sp. 17J80-10]QAU33149.1 hypothetical protein EKL02_02560 [Janthinobacterium sp. 17J80-10]